MLPAGRPAVVVHGKCLLPGQPGYAGLRRYSAGSSWKWVPLANAAAGPDTYARRMRTDRGRRAFYAAGWAISAGVMVVTFRIWQLHVREVEQRAEEAERTRDEAAQRRAMQERLRIARELHDSLTHSISVIRVQAGVAVHLARKRGEEVPPALLAIQEAGADAARELRTTLSVLRSEQDGDGSGLGQLDSLVSRARAAGLPVTVAVTGAERALAPEVDQAAYRIVQEALTNVSRHAGRACARVHLRYTPDALSVQVDDDGTGTGTPAGPRPAGPGLGLIGMRERVTALGGRLHAGPRDGGGFQVRAEFPARARS
jgi:signal transduction histidine kinase